MFKNIFKLIFLLITIFFLVLNCSAEATNLGDYPNKPITLIFVFSPGGSSDLTTRSLVAVAYDYLGVPIIASSIAGGGGTIGTAQYAKAKPDGYTLGLGTPTPLFIKPRTEKLPYSLDDLEPVALVLAEKMILTVNSEAPYDNLEEFIRYSKENKIKIGVPGLWTVNHVVVASLERKAGTEFIVVPYEGTGPATLALLGKHIDAVPGQAPDVIEFVKSGDLKVIAVFDNERDEFFPDVPTAIEQGYDVVGSLMEGIFAPKGVPEERLDFLSQKIGEIVEDTSYKQIIKAMGFTLNYMDRESFKRFVAEMDAMFEDVLRAEGLIK